MSLSSLPSVASDTDEDSNTTPSTRSTSSNIRKKRKSNVTAERSNKSHTSFFFRIDENNSELAYCKICELNLSGTNKKPYGYTRKGGNTSSMIAHLRDKHDITKDNYAQYLDEHKEVMINDLMMKCIITIMCFVRT